MNKKILEIVGLCRDFGEGAAKVRAVDNVSLSMEPGQILGVVGESGSGKSTLARIVMGLDKPTEGNILFENKDIFALTAFNLRRLRANFQMVFQDPYGSLDPRHKVWRIIAEPLHLEEHPPKGQALRNRIEELLEQVGLQPSDMDKYPHEFSGGQRQRIAIARALITKPKLLVADEATSALDLTVQAQILKLILKMRDTYGISVLFITHNIGVVDEICDHVAVMQAGKLVESGPVRDVLDHPREAYTQRLLAAEPTLEKIGRQSRVQKQAAA